MLNEEKVEISNSFIKHIHLENYKSIKQADINLTNLNILIGANGAGKSNFIGFFAFLQQMLKQNLRGYVMDKGRQDVFLCYGVKESDYLAASIKFINAGVNAEVTYSINLNPTNEGVFRFNSEEFHANILDGDDKGFSHNTGNLGYESHIPYIINLADAADNKDIGIGCVKIVDSKIQNIQIFHFHDTSDSSPLKSTIVNNDNLYLRSNGANLAAMLKLIYDNYSDYYRLIVDTIQMVVPDFHDFVIRDSEFITLEWFNKKNVDIPWKAHYLSDGSLRFIALATLLLMPSKLQPQTIIIDEPELGLHPTAIHILSGLIKRAAQDRQIIISTQSPALLANLEPEDIIVVDKKGDYSEFMRLDKNNLKTWLQDFSLPELWEMNILGG